MTEDYMVKEGLWLVVRSLKEGAAPDEYRGMYKLNVFDIIKLGRVSFKIKGFRF